MGGGTTLTRRRLPFSLPQPFKLRSMEHQQQKPSTSSVQDMASFIDYVFIEENPTAPSQNKKPRTLTACDRCRARKVKCEQAVGSEKCDACMLAHQECTFNARDQRFQHSNPTRAPSSAIPIPVSATGLVKPERKNSLPIRGHGTPSPPQRQPSRGTYPVHPSKRPESGHGHGRGAVDMIGTETTSSAAPMTNKGPRPLSHVSTSPAGYQAHGMGHSATGSPSSPPLSPVNSQATLLFDYPRYPTFPRKEHMPPLILAFFEHFGTFLPFLRQEDITARHNAGRLWNIHALAIAALASRFSPLSVHAPEPRGDHSIAYLSVAKPLITQYKGQMTLQALQGLIMLSWAECGTLQEPAPEHPMLSVLPGSPQFYITEAVRAARTLRLGFTAAINTFGVPKEEVVATWWSLVLIDELVAWCNNRPAMLEDTDSDLGLPLAGNNAGDLFYQVSALSLQRRKVGRALFAPNSSPGRINASMEGMKSVYADIRKNRPFLEFGPAYFQGSLRYGQGNNYMALHVLYHSVFVRARVHAMASMSFSPDINKDPAVTSAKGIVDLIRWCNAENRPAFIWDNMFIETPLYESGQVLSLASASMANAGLGSEFFLGEINEVHSTLRALSRFWTTASFKVASFSIGEQQYNASSTSISPLMSTMRIGSNRGSPMGHSYNYSHANISAPMSSPTLYAPGWHHQAGPSHFHSPHLHATSPTGETYYDQQTYSMGGMGRQRPASPHSSHTQQKQGYYEQHWPYSP